jgi:hypothetical protein
MRIGDLSLDHAVCAAQDQTSAAHQAAQHGVVASEARAQHWLTWLEKALKSTPKCQKNAKKPTIVPVLGGDDSTSGHQRSSQQRRSGALAVSLLGWRTHLASTPRASGAVDMAARSCGAARATDADAPACQSQRDAHWPLPRRHRRGSASQIALGCRRGADAWGYAYMYQLVRFPVFVVQLASLLPLCRVVQMD